MSKDLVNRMLGAYVEDRTEELMGDYLDTLPEFSEASSDAEAACEALRSAIAKVEKLEDIQADPLASLRGLLINFELKRTAQEVELAKALYKAGLSEGYSLRDRLNTTPEELQAALGIC